MYSVGVRIEGIEKRRRNSGLLHIIIGLFLILKTTDFLRYQANPDFISSVPLLITAGISLFYGMFRRRVDLTYKYNYWLRVIQVASFISLGIAMIRVGQPLDYIGLFLFAFLSILLLLSEKRIFEETNILFDESGILIPGYYWTHLVTWDNLENVVVREDFITLFHRKQKFLQFQVLQDLSTLEVAKMNAFCREQISLHETGAGNATEKPAEEENPSAKN
jgi:hypothetical protein